MSLSPPHVLITGGSRGIGLSIAQLFASQSYRCTLISRSTQSLQTAISSLPKPAPDASSHVHGDIQHSYITGDISSSQFWATENVGLHLRSAIPDIEEPQRVDVLVNCAGITQSSLFTRTSSADVEKIVNTNLTGMMLGTRYLLRKRHLTSGSVVVNVASLLGVKGGFGAVAYAASKAGVLGMFWKLYGRRTWLSSHATQDSLVHLLKNWRGRAFE
jgi:3-oxoacyl-[acyl-carrier protein] reductase